MRINPIARARTVNVEPETSTSRGVNVPTLTTSTALESAPAWSSTDLDAFHVFAEANRRTESGGVPTFSTLRTTAGAAHRASFGVAQLSVREHLSRLSRMSEPELAALGTSRAEVDAMRARGEAMAAFYHLLVDRRDVGHSADVLGLDASVRTRLRVLTGDRDVDGLRSLVGQRFTETTGLSSDVLTQLVGTRALRDVQTRAAFLARYAHDHGQPFDPMHRDAARMTVTARHLALSHAELAEVARSLGGDDAAYAAIGHYLGVGDSAENLFGWHARAAATATSTDRLAALLRAVDGTTSHARELENFERALASIARIDDLHGDARIATLARIGRMFHGSPTQTREALFVDGRLDTPRFRTQAELNGAIDQLREGRRWSDERLAQRVAEVLTERSST